MNIPPSDDDFGKSRWDDQIVDFSIDHLVERLHRLLVVLEDDWNLNEVDIPPVAVYDARASRWLLAAGVPLETLRAGPARLHVTASYVIVVGSRMVPVYSNDPANLMTEFVHCARASARV